jgi:hypothetical protein
VKTLGCAGNNPEVDPIKSETHKYATLDDYFAKIYQGWRYENPSDSTGKGKYEKANGYDVDISGLKGGPPTIMGALLTKSKDENGQPQYYATPKLVVGGKSSGPLTISANQPVLMDFFAWADDDQMPLKKISIDWYGDTLASRVSVSSGLYKNHKPICQLTDGQELGTCESVSVGEIEGFGCHTNEECKVFLNDESASCNPAEPSKGDRFGDTPDACTTDHFSFEKYYTCSKKDLPVCFTTDGHGKTISTNCWNPTWGNEGACQFIPRVQVLDNWGWCNGTCRTSGGCWSGNKDNGDFDFCDPGYPEDHWLNYSGVIYVRP